MTDRFLGSAKFAKVLSALDPLQCLDVGARGVPKDDLLNLAPAVELYGFEPDRGECERLNDRLARGTASPYRKIVYFPVALGRASEKRTLFITTHKGASSLLPPIADIGSQYRRDDYVTVASTCDVATLPLDDFLAAHSLHQVVHAKIDVEGAELEVLQSAPRLLASTLVSLRLEVSFLRTRAGQPSYGDIEVFLRDYHFIPMDFLELHYWRRMTRKNPAKRTKGFLPFSKGQVAHGDMLFFLSPERVLQRPMDLVLKSALIAMAFGYLDHAYYLITHSPVRKFLEDTFRISLEEEFAAASQHLYKEQRRSRCRQLLRRVLSR